METVGLLSQQSCICQPVKRVVLFKAVYILIDYSLTVEYVLDIKMNLWAFCCLATADVNGRRQMRSGWTDLRKTSVKFILFNYEGGNLFQKYPLDFAEYFIHFCLS